MNRFHSRLFGRFGSAERPRLCGWSSAESQEARFEALLRNARYNGGSIVDFGCGTGDLHAYISQRYGPVDYTGLDHNEAMLDIARLTHDARFIKCGFDDIAFEQADYVVASGVFQFRDRAYPRYYESLALALFQRARLAFAANFLSSLRETREKTPTELYLHPCRAAQLAASLSPLWILDHSYHPGCGDLTVAAFHTDVRSRWTRPRDHNTERSL